MHEVKHEVLHEIFHKVFHKVEHKVEISILQPDWLALDHPILNAKFPPITGLLNRLIYHKSTKVYPSPCPQILRVPQINEYLLFLDR